MRDTTFIVDTANTILEHNMLRDKPWLVLVVVAVVIGVLLLIHKGVVDDQRPRT